MTRRKLIQPTAQDGAFIAFAERYAPAQAAYAAYRRPDDTPEDNALYEEVEGIFAICMAGQPRTLQGLAAKARLVLLNARHLNGNEIEPDQKADQMARSIVHDILRLVGGEA